MAILRAIIYVLALALAVLLLAYFTARFERYIDLETGALKYERSIFGIVVERLSEYNFMECRDWENPRPGETGYVLVSRCNFITECADFEPNLYEEGCAQ